MKRLFICIIILFGLLTGCESLHADEDFTGSKRNYSPSAAYQQAYGICWNDDDPNDLGTRCFGAVGMQASYGIGAKAGWSDFDAVYPWSEIRRCNVRRQNGKTIVTYDDEPGFALDGSNGDVFVRIPKFCVQKYHSEGYSYLVVSESIGNVHPAFIEHGCEVDAVYVSAFEGFIGADSVLHSIADVTPTCNITAQDFLDAAQRRGPQYSLYDMRTVDMLFTLMAVEFGCRNSSVVWGHGIADYRQPLEYPWDEKRQYYSRQVARQTNTFVCGHQYRHLITVGSNICICDSTQTNILTIARVKSIHKFKDKTFYHFDGPPINVDTNCFIGSGPQPTNWIETCSHPHFSYMGRASMHVADSRDDERNPMRYRWMENLVGNVWHYLPDIAFKDCQMYVCSNMSDYKIGCYTGAYQPYGPLFPEKNILGNFVDRPGNNYWVSALMDDDNFRGVTIGSSFDRSLTSQKAFGATYYLKDGMNIVVNGGGFDHQLYTNLLTMRATIEASKRWHLYGARLIFKDIPDI